MSEPKSIFDVDYEVNILVAPGVTRKRYAHELLECVCCGASTYGDSQICTPCMSELAGYSEEQEIYDLHRQPEKCCSDDPEYIDR